VRNFNRKTMKKYLNLPADSERTDSLGDAMGRAGSYRAHFWFVSSQSGANHEYEPATTT
jgi:hypothetical protein